MSKYYKVSKVLAVRSFDGPKEFKVRWKGFGSYADSWVQEEDCNSVIKNYAQSSLKGKEISVVMKWVSLYSCRFLLLKPNNFLFSVSAKEKTISYIVYEIGQKLSVRIVPQKSYIRQTTVKVLMDRAVFDDLFGGVSRGRTRFDVTAEDLDLVACLSLLVIFAFLPLLRLRPYGKYLWCCEILRACDYYF